MTFFRKKLTRKRELARHREMKNILQSLIEEIENKSAASYADVIYLSMYKQLYFKLIESLKEYYK